MNCPNCGGCSPTSSGHNRWGDTWRFEYTATTVTAIRTDANAGWGHYLKLWCVPNGNGLLYSTDLEVATFGAPATRIGGSCSMPGVRYAITDDPVPGNLMNIMSNYNHDVTQSVEFYKSSYCSNNCFFFCCGWADRKGTRGQTCTKKSSDGGFGFLSTLYNFGAEHGSYGEYVM